MKTQYFTFIKINGRLIYVKQYGNRFEGGILIEAVLYLDLPH